MNIRDLHVLAYANGYTAWNYKHMGSAKELMAPGFFDDAATMLRHGDQIAIFGKISGLIVASEVYALRDTGQPGSPYTKLSVSVTPLTKLIDIEMEPEADPVQKDD